MNSRNGNGRRLIDRPLIDGLLSRRLDPSHLHQEHGSWCDLHGIEPGSLRRVRENIGFARDSSLAARAGFQLGIELPDPTRLPRESESAIEWLECVGPGGDPSPSGLLDFQIFVLMGKLSRGERVAAAVDESWCERNGVSIEAVERVCDTCGRFPNREAAAGSAFELAIEARAVVLTWSTAA